MPVVEDICWAVLKKAKGNSVRIGWVIPGDEPSGDPIQNAIGKGKLESELVLHYGKQQIEDSLYFLEKRGYLITHGIGMFSPGMAYGLTEKAIGVLDAGVFPDEEQAAFQESILDIFKPGTLGMKVNFGELYRRWKKRRKSD